jgi:hypothetical protein
VEGYCNSSLGSIKGREFIDELSDHEHIIRNLLLEVSCDNI